MLSPTNSSRRPIGLACALFAASVTGCEGEETIRTLPLGKYVTLYFVAETDEVACSGTGAHLDRYIERVFAFLAAPIPDDFHVDVHFVERNPCDESFLGCYVPDERVVYVEQIDQWLLRPGGLLRHEIAHAIVDRIWGWSAPFFNEGIAEALAGSWPTSPEEDKAGVSGLLDANGSFDYEAAARFTRFLIDTYGLEAFTGVHQSARDRSVAEIHAIFAETYGVEFEVLEAEYLNDEPRCVYQLGVCDPGRVIDVGRGWSTMLGASCSSVEAYGGTFPPETAIGDTTEHYSIDWTVEIETGGTYRLRSPAPLRFVGCGSCAEQAASRIVPMVPTDVTLDLEPGLYSLELEFIRDAGTIPVEIFPIVPP